jgi:acyl dehydratase
VRYQGASGDFDAAHHDDAHARKFGFEGVFSLGLLHAGIMSGYAVRHFGVENIRKYRVRFKDIVHVGDVLTYRGTITRKRQAGRHRLVDVDLVCERAGSKPVIVGEATFVIE